ncbi:MAG: hypothetical protein ACFE94_17705 [Candidatus Hodarchaeota archaeon]
MLIMMNQWWILQIILYILVVLSIVSFFRRIGRAFRRLGQKIKRGFRRVGKKVRKVGRRIKRSFRRVKRYQRKFAKTDPQVFQAIQNATAKNVKSYIDKNEWVKEKELKKWVKNKVAIEIEKVVQDSPMRDMRSLIDNTIDESINLAFLREVQELGDQLKIYGTSLGMKLFSRVLLPIITGGAAGLLAYNYPDKIPPGSLFIPEQQGPPTGNPPPPLEPNEILRSALINAGIYGFGALLLIGLIILIRRK